MLSHNLIPFDLSAHNDDQERISSPFQNVTLLGPFIPRDDSQTARRSSLLLLL
jgi:hypothetical protein